jgi:HopA1 effector protein family
VPVRASLIAAARLVRVSGGAVTVDGLPVGRRPQTPAARAELLYALGAALYSRWFAGWWPPADGLAVDRPLVTRLRSADAAARGHGWRRARAVPGGRVDVANGWWMTWGAAGAAPAAMVRVYWNCGPDAAPDLAGALVALLDEYALPFTLKCPTQPSLFERVDSFVLYLSHAGWTSAHPGLRSVHDRFAEQLRARVPPLTLVLGAGAALAEDPGDGRSFGESRAAAAAEGALRAAEAAVDGEDGMLASMLSGLSTHGIRPSRPYLRTGSPADALAAW